MKTINLSQSEINSIDLSIFDKYLMSKYKVSCEQGG